LQTEQAKGEMKRDNLDAAKAHLKKALSLDSRCVDAQLQLGELYWLRNKKKKALSLWGKLVRNNSKWAHLVFVHLQEKEEGVAGDSSVKSFLENIAGENLDAAARLALAQCYKRLNRKEQCCAALKGALETEPDLREARQMLGEVLLEDGDNENVVNEYRELLRYLGPARKRYRCQQCGLETEEILWKCPGCHNWDTVQPRKSTRDYGVKTADLIG
jgi:lipopolysaccharide biosynthesis regulator YciM